MKIIIWYVFLLSFHLIPFGSTEDQWDRDEREIERLEPAEFTDIPIKIIKELEQRNCTIPQPDHSGGHRNVIQGKFVKPKQRDWAILCSRNGVSSILVFWGGKAQVCPNEIALKRGQKFFTRDSRCPC